MNFDPSRLFIKCLRAAALVAGAVIFLATAQPISAEEQLVIATTGGTWEKQMREYFFDPFTAQTGIKIVSVSTATSNKVAPIKAIEAGGDIQWDLYQAGEIQAASEQHRSLNEDMTEFCRAYADNTDLLPGACKPSGVLSAYGTTFLAYNDNVFGEAKPKTWRDFFDVDRLPGPRAMPNFNDPWRVLAAALLADGVVPDKLFPLDRDRAFAKLATLRPHVGLWWKSGDQSTHGFRNGEYLVGEIWQTRAAALKAERQPIEWSQEQAFLVGDRWALIKGAPNRENALKFLSYFLATRMHRRSAAKKPPARRSPIQRPPKLSAEARSAIPTSPDVLKTLIVPDAYGINAHSSEMLDRWNMWLQQ